MSSIACDDGLFRILASRKLVSFAAVIGVVSGGEALRDDPSNGCEGEYARHFGVTARESTKQGVVGRIMLRRLCAI